MNKLKADHFKDEQTAQIVGWGHWFAFFNILLVMLIGSRYVLAADWPSVFMGRFYAIISGIGHFSFVCFFIYLLALFPLSFIIQSQRWQRIMATTVATIGISLLLIDIEIYTYFRMHLNGSIWSILTSSDAGFLNSVFVTIPFIILFETLLAIWSWKKLRSLNKRKKYAKRLGLFFIFCFVLSHLIHIWADANFYRPITMQRSSLPLSYPLTARHLLAKYGFLDEQEYRTRLKEEGNPFSIAVEYPLGQIQYSDTQTANNVLMIVIEGWTPQIMRQSMPWLTQFAKQNIQFTHHYGSSEQPYLNDFSLFYGLDPNYYNSILASHKSSVLFDTVARQRYNVGLFSTDNFTTPLYRRALFSNFSLPETSEEGNNADVNLLSSPKQPNDKITNAKVSDYWHAWYGEQLQLEHHAPLFSVVKYSLVDNGINVNRNGNELAMQAAQLDKFLDTMMAYLKKSGEYNNTIIVITGSNGLADNANEPNTLSSIDRSRLSVPLVMVWPGKKPMQVSTPTTHTDIMSTLMQEALNVTSSINQYSQGINLFTVTDTEPLRKWVIAGNENTIAALYNDMTVVIDGSGKSKRYDLNNQLQNGNPVTLPTFLQIVTTNRRFMVLKN